MRKPRDFDQELKALTDKARALKERKIRQLGELVTATGADALDVETLAGALLTAVDSKDATAKEGWRRRGAAFFLGNKAGDARPAQSRNPGIAAGDGGAASA